MTAGPARLFSIFAKDADPYLVREWILLVAWVYATYLFFTEGESFFGAIVGGFTFPLLIYGAVAAGLIGHSLESGQFGHIWTLPISREGSLALRVAGYVAPTAGLLVLPLVFLGLWASLPPSLAGTLPAFALMSTTLTLYVTFGGLVAATTRNALASSVLVFLPFLILPGYASLAFPHNLLLQGTLGSLRVLVPSAQIPAVSLVGLAEIALVQLVASSLLFAITYWTLRRSNLRSGR